jgi:acyl carrier protein
MSTREMLRTTLMNLLEEEMGESYPMLTDDQDLRESLRLDSVDVVGLVMRIEREFRIRLATEELATVKQVGDLLDLMDSKLAARTGAEGTQGPEPAPSEPVAIRSPVLCGAEARSPARGDQERPNLRSPSSRR